MPKTCVLALTSPSSSTYFWIAKGNHEHERIQYLLCICFREANAIMLVIKMIRSVLSGEAKGAKGIRQQEM